jgi:Raf kinase inhibitor-like YbhB/YbcL family protein
LDGDEKEISMHRKNIRALMSCLLLTLVFDVAACLHASVTKEEATMKLELTSPAFRDGESIPTKHTCDGEDASPPLKWSGIPNGAKSLALICDDPDAPAGTWVHWVLYDLPASVNELPEGIAASETTPQGAKQGLNDFQRVGYGGPCPPPGKPHRYFFKLYALDATLDLGPRGAKSDVVNAMKGHTLAEGQLTGTYKRK